MPVISVLSDTQYIFGMEGLIVDRGCNLSKTIYKTAQNEGGADVEISESGCHFFRVLFMRV